MAIIQVDFGDGKWCISPDPCRVEVNTPLLWHLRCRRTSIARLRWTLYFNSGTPFFEWHHQPQSHFLVTTELQNSGIDTKDFGDHAGAVGPLIPSEPGTYKYGLRLEDAESGEPIGDDDPQLIIVPY